jgi:hypothetical protein
MIYGIFHQGSGIGNQLHRYVGARIAALDRGEEFGMVAPELFKASSFLKLDMGKSMSDYHIEYPAGKVIPHTNETILDEEFQNENVWNHRIDEVREWLTPDHPYLEDIDSPDDLCIINFRGGEYKYVPSLYLPQSYWDNAIGEMLKINPNMEFQVETDDKEEARKFFPRFYIEHGDTALNWMHIRKAKYLILSNSSFAILPALLGDAKHIIAPKFWAGHNVGEWRMPDNQYKRFNYII